MSPNLTPSPSSTGSIYVNPNTPKPLGMIQPGNIDLTKLPVVRNPDGGYSTVYGTSFTDEKEDSPTYGKEVLVRGIRNGQTQFDLESSDPSKRQAALNGLKQDYYKTGKHLGVFSNPNDADRYAIQLHNDWSQGYIPNVAMGEQPPQTQSQTLTPSQPINISFVQQQGLLQLLAHLFGGK